MCAKPCGFGSTASKEGFEVAATFSSQPSLRSRGRGPDRRPVDGGSLPPLPGRTGLVRCRLPPNIRAPATALSRGLIRPNPGRSRALSSRHPFPCLRPAGRPRLRRCRRLGRQSAFRPNRPRIAGGRVRAGSFHRADSSPTTSARTPRFAGRCGLRVPPASQGRFSTVHLNSALRPSILPRACAELRAPLLTTSQRAVAVARPPLARTPAGAVGDETVQAD